MLSCQTTLYHAVLYNNNEVEELLEVNNFHKKFSIVLSLDTAACQDKGQEAAARQSVPFSMYMKAEMVSQHNICLVFPDNEQCPKCYHNNTRPM
jgi:hypothetical protein